MPSGCILASTNLPEIVAMCARAGETPQPRAVDVTDIDALVGSHAYPTPDAEKIALVQEWLPELSECAATSDLPPPWPDQTQASVFMTAVNFEYDPFPTRVYYDWGQQAQNTSLYYYDPPPGQEDNYVQVALLTGDTGYIRIEDKQGAITMCEQSLPGPQVPDWNEVDGCECRAQIAPGTVLNPSSEPTKILWCPTDLGL